MIRTTPKYVYLLAGRSDGAYKIGWRTPMLEIPLSVWFWLAAALVGVPLFVGRFIFTGMGEER